MSETETVTAAPQGGATRRRTSRWIDDWRPEDPAFWEAGGRRVARRNLGWSIFAEHLGFSVWLIWSVSSAFLVSLGFDFTPDQLFWLVALPNLVGSVLRLPYTFAVPRFGGGTDGHQRAAAAGAHARLRLGGAAPGDAVLGVLPDRGHRRRRRRQLRQPMANITFFFPAARKGVALGLNAAGGNLGVALIQLLPAGHRRRRGLFGLVPPARPASRWSGRLGVRRAGGGGRAAAYLFMDNLGTAVSHPAEQLRVVREPHTWIMSLLYIGTFGSFIGYSAALPLLIKELLVPEPAAVGSGSLRHFAFLGPLVGSADPAGGRLAGRPDRRRQVTLGAFASCACTLGVLWTLIWLPEPDPGPGDRRRQPGWFPWFLGSFLLVFAATGVGNGSTYRMIPAIWRAGAERPPRPAPPSDRGPAVGHAPGVGRDRGHRRGRRARRLPRPAGVRAPWVEDPGRHGGRLRGVHLLLRRVRARHLGGVPALPGAVARHQPGRREHLMTRTHCPYCALQCGMTLRAPRAAGVEVAARPDFPVNRGALCGKGWTAAELLGAPRRG